MRKFLKIIFVILLILFFAFILFFPAFFIFHSIKGDIEKSALEEAGYIQTYSAGQYNLSIRRLGNSASNHKLIGLSGMNVDNFSIEMNRVNEHLEQKYDLIYIDRAGYGYSDDTTIKQSLEQVVSDYRTALKNAGIEPPYILMPHSLGGIFATYWQSVYPDEIEGVIFIDTSELGIDIWDEDEYKVTAWNYVELAGSKIGLQRLFLHNYVYPLSNMYTKEEAKFSDYLSYHAILGNAKLSEQKEINTNTNLAFSSIKKNTIPKVYICCSTGMRTEEELSEYVSWIQQRQKEIGLPVMETPNKDKLPEILASYTQWEQTKIRPYIEKMGNTEIVYLPGDHMIFEQKPKELANIIDNFVKKLK